jgi:fucose permease
VGEEHTANTVGFQVAAAALGSALLPALIGMLAHRVGLEIIPLCFLSLGVLLFVVCELMALVPEAVRSKRLEAVTS